MSFTQADRAKIGQKANSSSLNEKMPKNSASTLTTDTMGAKGDILTPTDTGWTKIPQPNQNYTKVDQGEDVPMRALFEKKKH
jgi:hypothetical protein